MFYNRFGKMSCRYSFNPFFKTKPDWGAPFFSFLEDNDILDFHKALPNYKPTPLRKLIKLARILGIGELYIKDEGHRFDVKAFKPLGASYAIYRFLKKEWVKRFTSEFNFNSFKDKKKIEKLGRFTFCAASDGNHGKAVAWTAGQLGQKAVIYMPAGTVKARIDSIESEGAKVFVINGTYDDCVKRVSLEVRKNKWVEVADTAYKGYTEIPSWILNGYTTIFREMEETINLNGKVNVDYVFLQAGVGAFAAAGASYYVRKYLKKRPALICIEPQEAAGFLDSIEFGRGQPIAAKGKMETIMAGLNCGIPSLVAWPILKDSINLFIAISDNYSEDAMAEYFKEGIIAGESGASGLAGLIALLRDKNLKYAKNKLKITKKSRVLVINTEKDTDPENYKRILSEMGLK